MAFHLQQYIQNARNESATQPAINIDELLRAAENEDTQYLEGQTIESISKRIYDSLCCRVHPNEIQLLYSKLAGYRYVDELYLLHRGKYVRWIRNDANPPKLENGGIVTDIKITDTGVNILCKFGSRFMQYKFNECVTFQKLSKDEMLVLSAYTAIENTTS
jgi:hypothetical protein